MTDTERPERATGATGLFGRPLEPLVQRPVPVRFTLPDEETARWLDHMIARAGGDPDAWLARIVENDRSEVLAGSRKTLDSAAEGLAAYIGPGDLSRDFTTVADPPDRHVDTALARPSSDWRKDPGHD